MASRLKKVLFPPYSVWPHTVAPSFDSPPASQLNRDLQKLEEVQLSNQNSQGPQACVLHREAEEAELVRSGKMVI